MSSCHVFPFLIVHFHTFFSPIPACHLSSYSCFSSCPPVVVSLQLKFTPHRFPFVHILSCPSPVHACGDSRDRWQAGHGVSQVLLSPLKHNTQPSGWLPELITPTHTNTQKKVSYHGEWSLKCDITVNFSINRQITAGARTFPEDNIILLMHDKVMELWDRHHLCPGWSW